MATNVVRWVPNYEPQQRAAAQNIAWVEAALDRAGGRRMWSVGVLIYDPHSVPRPRILPGARRRLTVRVGDECGPSGS
jgi:hypothetical protein